MRVTEKKKIKIDHTCKDFPVYLAWINSVGGYSYWLFFKSHTERVSTRKETSYIKNTTDLEAAFATNDIVGKSALPTLEIGAKVLAEDMDGIQGLYQSPKVLMLTNPLTWETDEPVTGGRKPIWRRVLVKTGSLVTLKTKKASLDVKLTLELPLINTQIE